MRGPHSDELLPIVTGPEISTACRRACGPTRTPPCRREPVTRALRSTVAAVSIRFGRLASSRASSISRSLIFPKSDERIREPVVVDLGIEIGGEERAHGFPLEA